jgi:hypothetical protein
LPCSAPASPPAARVEILRYEIVAESGTLPLLKVVNMPQYYAEYDFENGRLIRFQFGHAPV